MKRLLHFLILACVSFTSCVSVSNNNKQIKNLRVYCKESFDPRATITVEGIYDDPCFAVEALNDGLVINGFNVMSERVAKERNEIDNDVRYSGSRSSERISQGRSTYMNSTYLITFRYRYVEPDHGGVLMTYMNGQIIDLSNQGEIVATFSYTHGGLTWKSAPEVMDALARELKN